MSGIFERLCNLIDDEVERQENVLAVCRAQSEAVKQNDLEFLEAKTAALVTLIQEAAQASQERCGLIEEILAAQPPEHRPNRALRFSDVVAAAPEPLRPRLEESHCRLRAALKATRPVAISNASSLRTALRVMNASLATLNPAAPSGAAYDATGMRPARQGAVKMVDQRG